MQEMQVQSLVLEDPLKEEMATHSSIFAWAIPWTPEPGGLQSMEPGGLQSMGLQRVGHDLATKPLCIVYCHIMCIQFRVSLFHFQGHNSFPCCLYQPGSTRCPKCDVDTKISLAALLEAQCLERGKTPLQAPQLTPGTSSLFWGNTV